MKKWLVIFLVGGISFLALHWPVQAQRSKRFFGDAAKHGWISSYREGLVQAKKSGKPLMVVIRCVP